MGNKLCQQRDFHFSAKRKEIVKVSAKSFKFVILDRRFWCVYIELIEYIILNKIVSFLLKLKFKINSLGAVVASG